MLAHFEYRLGLEDGPEFIRVEAGFLTDFASIPRVMWTVWPPIGGAYDKAAVVHDWLYQTPFVQHEANDMRKVNRGEVDFIFLEAMEVLEVGRMTRHSIHSAVRLGGWLPWRRYRNAPLR